MEFLVDLWLPILVGGIVLHVASIIAWIVLPHHFGDKKRLGEEDQVMQLVKRLGIAPGNYMFPYPNSNKEMSSSEYQAKYAEGPCGCLDVYPTVNMAKNAGLTLVYFLLTSLTIGYITHVACPPGEEGTQFLKVFRIAGTIGVLVYATSCIRNRIWFKARMWSDFLDGIVFGLLLGLVFAWLYKYPV